MSPAMSALASVGITHQILILVVLAVVTAGIIGMFWHIIVPGAVVVLVASLFFVAPDATPTKNVEVTKSTDVKVEVFDEYQAYMKDCMEVAEYPMSECKRLWENREEKHTKSDIDFKPASDVKLVDVDNVEYKVRRANTLAKPNAIVIHEVFQ